MNRHSSSARRPARLSSALTTTSLTWLDLVVWLLALACTWGFLSLVPLQREQDFSLGSTDSTVAKDFHLAETTDQGRGYRWTTGKSRLLLQPQGLGQHTLRFTATAPRPDGSSVPLQVTINDTIRFDVLMQDQTRRFSLLVPGDTVRRGLNEVRFESPTFVPVEVNNDPERNLGVVVFESAWQASEPQSWLLPAQIIAIMLVGLLLYLLLWRLGISFGWRSLILLLLIAINLAMRHSDTRFMFRWNALLMSGALALALAIALAVVWRWPAQPTKLAWRAWFQAHWRAFVGYLLATLVMLFPLISTMTSHIPGGMGDNLEYLWKMEWYRVALLEQHVSPTHVPQIFYPTGAELTISEMAPAHMLLWLPITSLLGATISYNLIMLSTFVLSGFFTYLLARRMGAKPGAAFVAGLVFAFCLRRFFHITGHFGMMGTQWLPLALYGWEGFLQRRRVWDGFVAGLAMVLASWSTLHYGATIPLLLLLYAPFRLGLRELPSMLQGWRALLVTSALCIVLVLPVAVPYAESQALGLTFKHRYEQLLLHTSTLSEYVLPNPYHPLWGNWVSQFYRLHDGGEHNFGIGYTLLLMVLASFWLARKTPYLRALWPIILVNIVMSLGPEWRFADGGSIKLPVWYVVNYVPVLSGIRTWSRMAMYVVLCCALLASLSLSNLPQRLPRWFQHYAWALASGLVLFEMISILPYTPTAPRAVDLWIGQQPGSGAVVQIPNGFGGQSEYYSLFTGKPTNQGTGKFPPPAFREGQNRLLGFPDVSSRRLFQRWGTEYIIIDQQAMDLEYPRWRERLPEFPEFREVYRDEVYIVYHFELDDTHTAWLQR